MTIEVRHMVIKSTVGDEHGPHEPPEGEAGQADGAQLQHWREEVLAECRQLLEMRLRDMTER
jgi:hypothetical protein